jgi:uncharacterized protein (DUF433 family)
MSTTAYPHITVDEDGTARIGTTRYKVSHLAGEHYHYGWTAEELLRQHPDLRPEEVYAALTWFYDHYAETVQSLKSSAEHVESLRKTSVISRSELLSRKQGSP